jgi:H+-transporting ATPase
MEKKIPCLRDGKAEEILTRLLVPGDVVLLMGGAEVPADIEWLEGDSLSIDTAALTGEPIPREYPSKQYGKLILCGSTVVSGEAYGIVRKTGTETEIGGAQEEIMKDKTASKVSVFEHRVLLVVQIIILVSLVDVIVIFLVQGLGLPAEFKKRETSSDLLTCLAIIIAAVPIALPLVLQVTMALGAAKMAREFDSVVTSLPALQDISSMTVLCCDKTGTLTTAKITIHAESVWTNDNFSKDDLALYAQLASNRDKKEDPIDRAVIHFADKMLGKKKSKIATAGYKKIRNVGFNPTYKRVLFEYEHDKEGKVTVAKGLPCKILNTEDGGKDDAEDQWKCDRFEELENEIKKVDVEFSEKGYKTLGVAVKRGNGPFKFVGILPMLDPPRHDTAKTIESLIAAGIEVKMCTGDHVNIAKETARLVGLGTNIYSGESIRDDSSERDGIIKKADGFGQVLPKDKRQVVLTLKDTFGCVVGMTGDGANDAPALSAAQCGIAVDDSTDAAKNAAAIILTSPGLSAIYSAVVESRRIFRKLKSYVIYRFAATILIVVVLSLLIFVSNCSVDALFVILLALFNDLTMLPIAYDIQDASRTPENPQVTKMLLISLILGMVETSFSVMFAYGVGPSAFGSREYDISPPCPIALQSAIWLQMFISAELLIFSVRAPKLMWVSQRPSFALFCSVLVGLIVASVLAGQAERFGRLPIVDICLIWCYDLVVLVVVDVFKVLIFKYFGEGAEILPDHIYHRSNHEHATAAAQKAVEGAGLEFTDEDRISLEENTGRRSMGSSRLSTWHTGRFSSGSDEAVITSARESDSGRLPAGRRSSPMMDQALSSKNVGRSKKISFTHHIELHRQNSSHLRRSIISSTGSLRPNTPAANLRGAKLTKKEASSV